MKSKKLIGGLIALAVALICVAVYMFVFHGWKKHFDMNGYTYDTPGRFEQGKEDYEHIIKINDSNVIHIATHSNSHMSPKAFGESMKFQMENDGIKSVELQELSINGYDTVLITTEGNSEHTDIKCYYYYIFAGESHLEIMGIFETEKADKYKKYVDEIANSFKYTGEEVTYPEMYEDENYYLDLQGKFHAFTLGSNKYVNIEYIAADTYQRGFSSMHIEKIPDVTTDLETYVEAYCEEEEATMSEGTLIDKYDCYIAYNTLEFELVHNETTHYFFEEGGAYYRVAISLPVGDEECREEYMKVLESWKIK